VGRRPRCRGIATAAKDSKNVKKRYISIPHCVATMVAFLDGIPVRR